MVEPKFKIGDKVTCGDNMPWIVTHHTPVQYPTSNFEYRAEGVPSYYDQGYIPCLYFLEEDAELYVESEPKLQIMEETLVSELFACSCGGEVLGLMILDEYVYMTIYYKNQRTIHRTLFERIRNAWYMLIGKDYKVLELVLPVENVKKQFEDFLNKIDKNK